MRDAIRRPSRPSRAALPHTLLPKLQRNKGSGKKQDHCEAKIIDLVSDQTWYSVGARSAALASATLGGYDASRYFDATPPGGTAAVVAADEKARSEAEFKYKPPTVNDFSTSSTSVTPSQTPHSHPGSGTNTYTLFIV